MSRRASPRGTIAMLLPILFLFFLLLVAPALYSSAEVAHPAADTAHPDEVAGIHGMFLSGNYILIGLIVILALGMIFVAFSTWKIRT